ncbi:MAG: phosphopentomutase [Bdellovibrionota bacterium]
MSHHHFDRVILVVLDSVGMGAAADASRFGDERSHTLGNIAQWCAKNSKPFLLPNLNRWGIGELVTGPGFHKNPHHIASLASLEEISPGKDTTTGHWEISGTPLTKNFPVYPAGFAEEVMKKWAAENGLSGWLLNAPGSGTQVLSDYGLEHMRSGKPIVYTSADSVWQIAAHEKTFGLERLYEICRSARKYADTLGLGRVIARPFVGDSPQEFKRTENRRDFSEMPPEPNMLDALKNAGHFVGGVGKIEDIFAHRGLTLANHTGRNETSQEATLEMIRETEGQRGLIFTNLIDFDMLYGHRRDPAGYADCLMRFDDYLPRLETVSTERDLVMLTADHGNDPTHSGTDHTREDVPFLFWSKNSAFKAHNFGRLRGFHHIARLALESLGLDAVRAVPTLADTASLLQGTLR